MAFPSRNDFPNFFPFDRSRYRSQSDVNKYVRALLDEIDLKKILLGILRWTQSLWVGGRLQSCTRTKSGVAWKGDFTRNLDLGALKELPFEVEVKSATPEKLRTMRHIGVNRISFGAQTFSEESGELNVYICCDKTIIDTAAIANSLSPLVTWMCFMAWRDEI